MKNRLIFIVLILMVPLLNCTDIFFPEVEVPSERNYEIKANSSPENVLENLKTAYNNKDLELFKNLLSKDFKFAVNVQGVGVESFNSNIQKGVDLNCDNSSAEVFWLRDEEIAKHEAMFRSTTVSVRNIYLEFEIPDTTIRTFTFCNNAPLTVIKVTDIILNLEVNGVLYISENSSSEFYLKKNPDDTLNYQIALWYDVGSQL
jgi:hypothetical protein